MTKLLMTKPDLHRVLIALLMLGTIQLCWAESSSPSIKALAVSADSSDLDWLACPEFLPCTFAIVRGELGGNDMDIFLKFPSKAEIPFHTHTSSERMIMIRGEFHTTYEGQDRVKLNPGDYAYSPAELAHDGYCASQQECILFVAYDTPLDAVLYPLQNK